MKKYVIMYHWSNNAPQTSPADKYRRRFPKVEKIIFLTSNPHEVALFHGKNVKKHLYVIRVPKRVKANALFNGIYDHAHECVLTEEQWKECEVIGKVSEKKKEKFIIYDEKFLNVFKKEWELGSNNTNMSHLSKKKKIKILKTKIPSLIKKKEDKIKIVKEISRYTSARIAFEIYRKIVQGFPVNKVLQIIE